MSTEKPGTVWNYSAAQVSLPDGVAILSGVRPLSECPDGIAATHDGKPYWLIGRFNVEGVMYSLLIPRALKEHAWEEVDPSVERVHFKNDTLRVFVCSKCGRRNLEEQIQHSGGCSEVKL